MELLTQLQKERKEKYLAVASEYDRLRTQYPKASRNRIFEELQRIGVGGFKSKDGIRSAIIAIKGRVPK